MIITGSKKFGVAKALSLIYPDAEFCSRATGYDLGNSAGQNKLAELVCEHDIFINCVALYKFNQTTLLNAVYQKCLERNHYCHIINIGSTTDRVKRGGAWLYNAEKKALRDYTNTLGINGVWEKGPKLTLISLGTLSNNAEKHPNRKTLDINKAAEYIKWVIDQPKHICINEISIDPMQPEYWYE